jgi:hypothetical protein
MVLHPKRCGLSLGILQTHLRGVGKWHHHGMYAFLAQRIHRKRQRQCGINASGKSKYHAAEAVFLDIVT